jgi:hypothetical protein
MDLLNMSEQLGVLALIVGLSAGIWLPEAFPMLHVYSESSGDSSSEPWQYWVAASLFMPIGAFVFHSIGNKYKKIKHYADNKISGIFLVCFAYGAFVSFPAAIFAAIEIGVYFKYFFIFLLAIFSCYLGMKLVVKTT